MSDLETIIEKCKKNDKNAQASLYSRLAPAILGICLRYMPGRDEAEDVMQDVFVKVFMNIKSFRGEGSFDGWAKRIAVNTALNALKKSNAIHFERNLEIVENIDFSDGDESQCSVEEIMQCMEVLPLGYRTIINLYLVEDLSHNEIASLLKIQESTSRSQYTRARQALLKLVKEKMNTQNAKNA